MADHSYGFRCAIVLYGAGVHDHLRRNDSLRFDVRKTDLTLVGFVIVGLGCAPIYPCIIHSTPRNFGAENSQGIIGIQMASAYVGSTIMPPVFGLIANHFSLKLMPVYLAFFFVLMIVMIRKMITVNERIAGYAGNREIDIKKMD